MRLSDLPLTDARFDPRFAGLELTGIASDSRKVTAGCLFVAVPGTKADGLAFVAAFRHIRTALLSQLTATGGCGRQIASECRPLSGPVRGRQAAP